MTAVNAGARLDRLPIAAFHYRVLGLIAAGMFLDAFEIYLQGSVLASLVTFGFGAVAYVAAWLLVPAAGAGGCIGSRAGEIG